MEAQQHPTLASLAMTPQEARAWIEESLDLYIKKLIEGNK